MAAPTVHLTHELPPTADLVVIGGGIIGAATAYFAARERLRVVVLERRPLLGTLTTSAATGAFRLQFDNADETALVREGVELYTHFAEATGLDDADLRVRQQGYLWIVTTDEAARRQRELVERQRGWGLRDVEVLDATTLRRRFPYVGGNAVQARFRAGDGWLEPGRLTVGYARASGATFVVDTEAIGLERAGDRVTGVKSSRGVIAAANVLIAAGPFSGVVAAWAGIELPLALVRRQRLLLPDVPEVPQDAPMTIDEETGAHWRPAGDGAHLLWTRPGVPAGPPLDDVPPDDAYAFSVLDPASPGSVARITPFWRDVWARGASSWSLRAGQYDYTPDHRPLLGPTRVGNLAVNCGYSGHGVMSSAGGSRLAVATMLGRLAPEQNPFRADRTFEGRELDLI